MNTPNNPHQAHTRPGPTRLQLEQIRHIIAVSSGKGGVGKSTVAVNLALALAGTGARVGLLDADVYGPNVPLMLGITDQHPLPTPDKRLQPVAHAGLEVISMALLVKADQPLVWRGPMVHNTIRQFLSEVAWGPLDYLIADLPPGTGDAQISLAQLLQLSGAIIVTTPQLVALTDVRRAIGMFAKMQVPVLGIIENMSGFTAPDTGRHYAIFGSGGGQAAAEYAQAPLLAQLPIDARIAAGGDQGQPFVSALPDTPEAQAMHSVAAGLRTRLLQPA